MDLTAPRPRPSAVTQPFWDGLREKKVRIQRCARCDAHFFYPRAMCPTCWSPDVTWETVSGSGTLHTFTVGRVPTAPHFADEVPQKIGVVELDEGPRMTALIVGTTPEELEVGMRLAPVFDALPDAPITLLRYRPA